MFFSFLPLPPLVLSSVPSQDLDEFRSTLKDRWEARLELEAKEREAAKAAKLKELDMKKEVFSCRMEKYFLLRRGVGPDCVLGPPVGLLQNLLSMERKARIDRLLTGTRVLVRIRFDNRPYRLPLPSALDPYGNIGL